MSEAKLRGALQDGLTPANWYRISVRRLSTGAHPWLLTVVSG